MEEIVALDSTKQKQFVKSIKGIKKLIKKAPDVSTEENTDVTKSKKKNNKRKKRGLVYLGHIPHGFYENEMTQYFKQFGAVTNVRVIRSKRTGNSKGFAFVEFKDCAVAQVVAETMNNYLMGKRLIKASYIPPEKQKLNAMRKHWTATNNPGMEKKLQIKKAHNANKDDKEERKWANKTLKNWSKTKQKLGEMGIDYDFFAPVDVPEELSQVKKEDTVTKKVIDQPTEKKNFVTLQPETRSKNKTNKTKAEKKQTVTLVTAKDKVEQKQKTKQTKSVKHTEEFIKIKEDSDSGSDDFDSDEYEKMLQGDDDSVDSGSDEETGDDDNEESDNEDSYVEPPKKGKINKGKKNNPSPKVLAPLVKKAIVKKSTKPELPRVQQKRKATQKKEESVKKPKFEKQKDQKPLKKQFKKKK